MLVLTRRIGEEIVVAGNIRVKVLAANGPRVRLGITAPASVPVARLELTPARTDAAQPELHLETRRTLAARQAAHDRLRADPAGQIAVDALRSVQQLH